MHLWTCVSAYMQCVCVCGFVCACVRVGGVGGLFVCGAAGCSSGGVDNEIVLGPFLGVAVCPTCQTRVKRRRGAIPAPVDIARRTRKGLVRKSASERKGKRPQHNTAPQSLRDRVDCKKPFSY